jgi:hypothetical protein
MELYSISFASHYYTTTQGRKKLTQVEHEIKSLINIRHTKLQTVFGVKLILPRGSDPPKLMVLNEQAPTLTLHDVLEECECFREDRASVRTPSFLKPSSSQVICVVGLLHADPDSAECPTPARFGAQRLAALFFLSFRMKSNLRNLKL